MNLIGCNKLIRLAIINKTIKTIYTFCRSQSVNSQNLIWKQLKNKIKNNNLNNRKILQPQQPNQKLNLNRLRSRPKSQPRVALLTRQLTSMRENSKVELIATRQLKRNQLPYFPMVVASASLLCLMIMKSSLTRSLA